jgi:hypothetical protein
MNNVAWFVTFFADVPAGHERNGRMAVRLDLYRRSAALADLFFAHVSLSGHSLMPSLFLISAAAAQAP